MVLLTGMREGDRMKILNFILLIIGIFSLIYYGVIVSYAGSGSSFSWFWLLVGIICLLIFALITYMIRKNISLPQSIPYLLTFLILVGLSIFILIEGLIIYHANKDADPNMDYLIVLGAQIRGTRITNSLRNRLEASEIYLKDNPDTLVIVSGGQGSGEDISEAEAMKRYLLDKGIAEDRIIVEEESKNTVQNILCSKKLITRKDSKVAVVTNGFHVFRSMSIAKKQGLENVQGLSASSDPILFINYYVREVLAIIKDFLVGNM